MSQSLLLDKENPQTYKESINKNGLIRYLSINLIITTDHLFILLDYIQEMVNSLNLSSIFS